MNLKEDNYDKKESKKSEKNLVARDNVYVGLLIKKLRINYPSLNAEANYSVIRKILFSKTNNSYASDLLYTAKDYEIDNGQSNFNSKLVVMDPIKLDSLLRYFEFSENLTKSDIAKIYTMFLSKNKKRFYLENYDLFGYDKNKTTNLFYYEDGRTTSKPIKIQLGYMMRKLFDTPTFSLNKKEHPISSECFSLIDIIDYKKEPDLFEEGHIKTKVFTLF